FEIANLLRDGLEERLIAFRLTHLKLPGRDQHQFHSQTVRERFVRLSDADDGKRPENDQNQSRFPHTGSFAKKRVIFNMRYSSRSKEPHCGRTCAQIRKEFTKSYLQSRITWCDFANPSWRSSLTLTRSSSQGSVVSNIARRMERCRK